MGREVSIAKYLDESTRCRGGIGQTECWEVGLDGLKRCRRGI